MAFAQKNSLYNNVKQWLADKSDEFEFNFEQCQTYCVINYNREKKES